MIFLVAAGLPTALTVLLTFAAQSTPDRKGHDEELRR